MAEVRIAEGMTPPVVKNCDYLCEMKLQRDDPELHKKYTDSVVAVQMMLNKYRNHFPNFTDHTILHSIEVIEFMNHIIGENISKLNCDEIYILMMAAYLHDSGMGISEKDYEEFKSQMDLDPDITDSGKYAIEDVIRIYHHEFSGKFIDKYAPLFDIPSSEHIFAIKQASRGHRKTDLLDEKEYPVELVMPNGNKVCLPYLAALIRLADELDIAADRNLAFLYDVRMIRDAYSLAEFKKHIAIKHLYIGDDGFYMCVDADNDEVYHSVVELMGKLKKTLEECITAVRGRTPFDISQECITMIPIGERKTMA